MGAFKDRTGKSRAGSVLSSVGGFFSNIFGRKDNSKGLDTSANSGTSNSSGRTGVGRLLSSIGGFFTNIFGRTSDGSTGNTPNGSTGNTANGSTGNTQNGSGWTELLIGIGGVVGVWLGNKVNQNGDYSTDPTIFDSQKQQEQDQKQGIGQNVIIGIVLIIVSVLAYIFLRKK